MVSSVRAKGRRIVFAKAVNIPFVDDGTIAGQRPGVRYIGKVIAGTLSGRQPKAFLETGGTKRSGMQAGVTPLFGSGKARIEKKKPIPICAPSVPGSVGVFAAARIGMGFLIFMGLRSKGDKRKLCHGKSLFGILAFSPRNGRVT